MDSAAAGRLPASAIAGCCAHMDFRSPDGVIRRARGMRFPRSRVTSSSHYANRVGLATAPVPKPLPRGAARHHRHRHRGPDLPRPCHLRTWPAAVLRFARAWEGPWRRSLSNSATGRSAPATFATLQAPNGISSCRCGTAVLSHAFIITF